MAARQLKDIIGYLNDLFPQKYACAWDKTNGLQLGSLSSKISKVVLTLNSEFSSIKKTIKAKPGLIITHHPLFFNSPDKIDLDTPIGKTIKALIESETALFSAHTNMDAAPDGINYHLALKEGLAEESLSVIEPTYQPQLYKFVIFVPENNSAAIRKLLGDLGAGHLGNYSHCDFVIQGDGHFKPLAGSNPYIGSKNRIETVREDRIETILSEDIAENVIPQVLKAHPYEEPAYDLYPLAMNANPIGIGLIGTRKKDKRKVAVCSGSGGSLIQKVYDLGAREYITGEAGYHDQLLAGELGLKLTLKGHYETEAFYLKILAKILTKAFKDLEVIVY